MDAVPTLVGIAGHVEGQEFPLEYGKKVIVGRSRSADWSLVQLPSWAAKSKQEQEDDHAFRTISGKHFEITMYNLGSIEVVNLSSNGTRLDGEALDRETITDVATNSHEIAFGADEVVKLELRGGDAGTADKPGESDEAGRPEPSAETREQEKPQDSDPSDKSDESNESDSSGDSDVSEKPEGEKEG